MKKINGVIPPNITVSLFVRNTVDKALSFKAVPIALLLLILMILILTIGGCAAMARSMFEAKRDYINNISFSADGKEILFDRLKGSGPSQIQVYNLTTGELRAYQSPANERWSSAQYSFDGRSIAFVIYPMKDKTSDYAGMYVAIMDPDGRNVRKVTRTSGPKGHPSFSHDGKKIIYAMADKVRETGPTRAVWFDVYEVEIASGKETCLTRFRFFQMSRPFYLPDDHQFIFAGEWPTRFPGIPDDDRPANEKMLGELQKKYKENEIFLMRPGEEILKPYIEFFSCSIRPMLSADGQRLFFTAFGKPEKNSGWHQYYLYSPDGRHRCLTDLIATTVWSGAVSPQGDMLAAVYDLSPDREIHKIVVFGVEDGVRRDIVLPDKPTRIINGTP